MRVDVRKAGIAALVIALAFGLVACKPRARGVVTFIGDSNLEGAATALVDTLNTRDNGYVEYFLGTTGTMIRTPDCASNLPAGTSCTTYNFWKVRLGHALSQVNTDAIVVELGINDAAQLGARDGPGYSFYDEKIDWFMALLPSDKPVLWTNLPCAIEPTDHKTGCAVVNAALTLAPIRHTNLAVLDWGAEADTHPEYMQPNDVHYSAAGNSAYATFIAGALDARIPPPPDDPTTSTSTATSSSTTSSSTTSSSTTSSSTTSSSTTSSSTTSSSTTSSSTTTSSTTTTTTATPPPP
jgi:lysophospholipase L1-like esterase